MDPSWVTIEVRNAIGQYEVAPRSRQAQLAQ
jgi:hypothetical protein